MVEPNTIPIDLKRRPAEEVPAAAISLWAKECGLSLTAAQIQMLALQWRVSLLVAIAEETIKVDCAARQAAAQDAYEQACKAMCSHCGQLVAVECLPVHGWVHFVNDGLQPRGEAGRYADCQAAAIRALAAAEAWGAKAGDK